MRRISQSVTTVTLAWIIFAGPAAAFPLPLEDTTLCHAAIQAVTTAVKMPTGLMTAISFVESGRLNPRTGTVVAWPWTVNIAGTGHFFSSKTDAVTAVQAAQSAGVQSIDVGCMQINLRAHPQAFANLDEAFDPSLNVHYAMTFLQKLYYLTGSWPATIEAYHSSTPEVGEPYGRRVGTIWPLYAFYGGSSVASNEITARFPPFREAQAVDPYRVMTPEFRAELTKDAAFRRQRDADLGVVPLTARPLHGAAVAAALPRRTSKTFALGGACPDRFVSCSWEVDKDR